MTRWITDYLDAHKRAIDSIPADAVAHIIEMLRVALRSELDPGVSVEFKDAASERRASLRYVLELILGTLDPELVQEVRELLEQIAREGMTMIVVTHEVGFAKSVAHRCLFLDGGDVAEEVPSKAFFEAPRSARLKQFLDKVRH